MRHYSGAERAPSCKVRQVRGNRAVRLGAAHGVAAGAPTAHEYISSQPFRLALRGACRLPHGFEPAVEIGGGLGDHVKRHVRVLETAKLGALAAEYPVRSACNQMAVV
jgi:hypothetical protein